MHGNKSAHEADWTFAKHVLNVWRRGDSVTEYMLKTLDRLPKQLFITVRHLMRDFPTNFVIALLNQVYKSKERLTDALNRMQSLNEDAIQQSHAYLRYCWALRQTLKQLNITIGPTPNVKDPIVSTGLDNLKTAQVMFHVIFYNNITSYLDRMVETADARDFKDTVCTAWAHLCPLIQHPHMNIHRLRVERQQYEPPRLYTDVSDTYEEYVAHATDQEMSMLNNKLSQLKQVAYKLYDAIQSNPLFKDTRMVRNDPEFAKINITQYFYTLPSGPVEKALLAAGGLNDYVIIPHTGQSVLRADVQHVTHPHLVPSPTSGAVYTSTNFDHFAELSQIAQPDNRLIDLLKEHIYRLKFSTQITCTKCKKAVVQAIQSGSNAELPYCSIECATSE